MYRRIPSFESVRSQNCVIETKFTYPTAISINEMIEPEFKLMLAIGGGDVTSCWENFHRIAIYQPTHLRHWGEKFCEHNLHRLACVAFSKSFDHERMTSREEIMINYFDEKNTIRMARSPQPMLDDMKNLFAVSYASHLFDDVRIDELKFNWSCEAAHLALGSRTIHLDLFDQVRFRISYEVEMIHLLKVMLKLKPFPVYDEIHKICDFYNFLKTWKFPQENQPEAWKNLLDVRYYLSVIEKNVKKRRK